MAAWLGAASSADAQTPGSVDSTFNTGGFSSRARSVAVQSDGKIIAGGDFTTINGVARNRVARLSADGSLDTTFNPSTGPNDSVNLAAAQTDGKVYIGGAFGTVNGIARVGFARLNTDGSVDTGFVPGANDNVRSVAVQSDAKIIVGGNFTTLHGVARNYIARLSTDGSVDTAFNPGSGANNSVYSVALQSDGKVLIGGAFGTINGTARSRIARLNIDGSVDTGFVPGSGADDYVFSVAVQGDGKIVIGGSFTTINGVARNRVARLNADGSLDTTFSPSSGADGAVRSLAAQSDGKIVLGGDFTMINGTARSRIARLNADGSLDAGFNPGTGGSSDVLTVALQSDGRVLVGGYFSSFNGTAGTAYLARLNGGSVAATPSAMTGAADTVQSGSTVVRASVNPQGAATTVVFQYGATTSYGSTTGGQNVGSGTSPVPVSAALTGLTPATSYHYRAVATNSAGTTNGADATFTTLSLAQDWRQQFFGSTGNAGSAADAADPDGDGIVNLLERALGLNPTAAGVAGLPAMTRDASSGRLTLTASKGAYASDLSFNAETSSDLVNWSTSGVTVLVNTSTMFQARDDGPASARRAMRLRVTAP